MAGSKGSKDYDWGEYSEKGDRIIAVLGWIVVLLITLYAGIYFGRQTREKARFAEREAAVQISTVRDDTPSQPAVEAEPEPAVDVNQPAATPVPEPKPVVKPVVVKEPAPVVEPPAKAGTAAETAANTEETVPDVPVDRPAIIESPIPQEGFSVQVGAFGQLINAQRLKESLGEKGYSVHIISSEGPKALHRVRVGLYDTREAADTAQLHLKDLVEQTLVVKNAPR